MNSKKALILLVLVSAINVVFFSFQRAETILLSLVFIVLAILILKLTLKRSALFLISVLILIIVQTTTFYIISQRNENLKKILVNNSKWEWDLDDVNYSILIKHDSISFYDENEFIDDFFFEIDDNKIYFKSKEGERFTWEIIGVKKNLLKIKDEDDIILVSKLRIRDK